MKYLFISMFLFLSSALFGKYDPNYLIEYIKNDPIPLNYGVKEVEPFKLQDFSKIKPLNEKADSSISLNSEAIIPFSPVNDYWYTQDFSEDPFDGKIEILVIGEPLPSVPLTLFISTLLLFTYLKYRKLHTIQEIS